MVPLLNALWITAAVILILALALSLPPHMGRFGRRMAHHLTRAYWLDLLVATFTWLPWVIGAACAGWKGFVGALLGQFAALFLWVWIHETIYRKDAKGPRIVKVLNRTVGRWRNHAALWVTMIALPGFWFIRLLEILIYPALVWLLDFPKYRQGDWVNVSRHKFSGLIGHDLIWCLYCDWMTGVYALGAEMLRNVESFWCPIRFYDGKKCENCRTDFPDIDNGWVAPTGTMADVAQTLEAQYGQGERSWFGHPARLTVKGKEPPPGK